MENLGSLVNNSFLPKLLVTYGSTILYDFMIGFCKFVHIFY